MHEQALYLLPNRFASAPEQVAQTAKDQQRQHGIESTIWLVAAAAKGELVFTTVCRCRGSGYVCHVTAGVLRLGHPGNRIALVPDAIEADTVRTRDDL